MFLISNLRLRLTAASPYVLHCLMLLSFVIYTLIGAACIRAIENAHIDALNSEAQSRSKRNTQPSAVVLSGAELAAVAPSLRPCVQSAIRDLLALADCRPEELRTVSIQPLDDCYRYAEIDINQSRLALGLSTDVSGYKDKSTSDEEVGWTFHNSILFSFTLITTVGYGHIAPSGAAGRAFCLVYGIIGIPLALLSIANLGMFIRSTAHRLLDVFRAARRRTCQWRCDRVQRRYPTNPDINKPLESEDASQAAVSNEQLADAPTESIGRDASESAMLVVLFIVYLLGGSLVMSLYEPDMDVFQALYFNWVSLSTIGLGDIVPKNDKLVWLTCAYIAVGLALTTLFIDIASDMLRKLHYFGRKLENAGATQIYFGGRKMKLKALLKHLGDQLNVPADELKNLDVTRFVDDSIRVANGELKTLRVGDGQSWLCQSGQFPEIVTTIERRPKW